MRRRLGTSPDLQCYESGPIGFADTHKNKKGHPGIQKSGCRLSSLNALDDANENNDQAACSSLQAFINSVEAQRGNKITDEQADTLIQSALAIMDLVCP